MLFGEGITPAHDASPAAWIAGACRGAEWTVGALVPNGYPVVLRIAAPDPDVVDWWSAYRDLYSRIAAVGRQHTASVDRAWFAVWDGHGFASSRPDVAWRGPLDQEARQALDERRRRLWIDGEQRNAARRAALLDVPTFELPHRRYHLLAGAVSSVSQLRHPDGLEWRNPDLFWPDDRRWFVATDVDFWSVYVGGDPDLADQLTRSSPTGSEIVHLDRQLDVED